VVEEQKVAALVTGSRLTKRRLQAVLGAVRTPAGLETDPRKNPALRSAVREARAALVPEGYIQRVLQLAGQGVRELDFPEYDTDWDSEAYYTVSGQNSNNSVRVPNAFFDVLARKGQWDLRRRTDGKSAGFVPAEQIWDEIAHAAWACADPGVQYDTTINEWHTCPEDGRINASNPCVTGETLVATAEGWQRIDALAGRTARIIGSDGQPHLVSRIFPTGHKPVFDLRTRLGYRVRITGDHRVLTVGRGDVAVWDRTYAINLRGAFLVTDAAAPHLERYGGSIVLMSSTAGQRGEARHSAYAASKGALISYTKSLAAELGPRGIRVNAVAPGWVDTDMSAPVLDNPLARAEIEKSIPIGRVASAADIAGPILFLVSDLARHLQGEVVNVNGGSVLVG